MIDIFNYQPDIIDRGIYHNMHNARYFMGIDTGASMVHTLAACEPVNVAVVITQCQSFSLPPRPQQPVVYLQTHI